ncbi:hypothetical protein OC845_001706 [Tilletia horrida]|nr:hypothetical protein OC845_001706 [Tilletia horrida]
MAPTRPRADEHGDEYVHVLLTGFSQFGRFDPNPSWLAVQPLHNTIIDLAGPAGQDAESDSQGHTQKKEKTKIHIQCIQVPVAWRAVLDVVPHIHGRLQAASPYAEPWLDPKGEQDGSGGDGHHFPLGYSRITLPKPGGASSGGDNKDGPGKWWDFILHVGTGRNGGVAIETLAHKDRYVPLSKDVRGEGPPPIVEGGPRQELDPEKTGESDIFASHTSEKGRDGLGASSPKTSGGFSIRSLLRYIISFFTLTDAPPSPQDGEQQADKVPYFDPTHPTPGSNCGFGKGYEHGRAEEHTLLDVPALVDHLNKLTGEELGPVKQNFDPGRYLCDFIYYASLAEARRGQRLQGPEDEEKRGLAGEVGDEESKETPVLFIHCPDVGQPQTSEQVSALLKEVVKWVCQRH